MVLYTGALGNGVHWLKHLPPGLLGSVGWVWGGGDLHRLLVGEIAALSWMSKAPTRTVGVHPNSWRDPLPLLAHALGIGCHLPEA